MIANARNLFGFSLLAALAVATWVLSRPAAEDEPQTRSPAEFQVGYYLRNAELHGTNAEGRIYYRVFAARVEQSAHGDDLVLEQVRVEYEPDTEVRWSLTARAGFASKDGAYLDLVDGVRLINDDVGADPAIIETQALRLHAESSMASSDSRIAIRRGDARFEATGLRADLKQDYLELQSDVTVRIAP